MKAVELLPEHLKKHANGLKDKQVEEFRLRVGQHPTAVIAGEENDLKPIISPFWTEAVPHTPMRRPQ